MGTSVRIRSGIGDLSNLEPASDWRALLILHVRILGRFLDDPNLYILQVQIQAVPESAERQGRYDKAPCDQKDNWGYS